jgi:RimJ/RimL family protein N-acetyltransferase
MKKEKSPEHNINFAHKIALQQGKGGPLTGGSKGGFFWHIYWGKIKVGRVFINFNKEYIQIILNKKNQGKGIGKIVYQMACEKSGYERVYAEMSKKNIASIMAATAAGFEKIPSETQQMLMMWKKNELQNRTI